MRHITLALLLLLLLLPSVLWGAKLSPILLRDMETTEQFTANEITKNEQKIAPGTMQLVPGKEGRAIQFSFIDGAKSGFFMTRLQPTPEWDQTAALSFWVKGDGSSSWGAIELINEDFRGRYASCFPLDSTGWKHIEIPWSYFVPETATAPLFKPLGAMKPSDLRYLYFGKWHYWREYPAASFAIDSIALDPVRHAKYASYPMKSPGVVRTLAKLKAKQPVTIVTMGDSLSDKAHWANRELLWSEFLVKNLEQQYGGNVTLVNPAIGGAQLTYGLIYAPRWLKDHPTPDLITILYGYNDFSDNSTPELFQERLRFVVDRMRELTQGQSDIMLITTAPAIGRWTEMEGLAQAVRDVALEKKTGLADLASAFHRAGDDDAAARKQLFCSDEVHLGDAGHRLLANTVQEVMGAGK